LKKQFPLCVKAGKVDGRMPGDGVRRGTITDDHHFNAGTIVMPPKASQPARERRVRAPVH
jgi:hypothetical protein